MGCSLTVLKSNNIDNALLEEDFLILERQRQLDCFDTISCSRLGKPTTELRFDQHRRGHRCFKVRMMTETRDNPVYVNTEPPQMVERYQEIREFEFWISENQDEIYVFAPKTQVKTFVERLEKEDWIETENTCFDFKKLPDLERLISARGTWEDSKGSVKRVARFGQEIDREMSSRDFEATTTFYIDYLYRSLKTQIILNRNGRISTNEDLSNQELYEIYKEISSNLITSEELQSEENRYKHQNRHKS